MAVDSSTPTAVAAAAVHPGNRAADEVATVARMSGDDAWVHTEVLHSDLASLALCWLVSRSDYESASPTHSVPGRLACY